MFSATVTPSLVTLGEPHPLSSTALRPRGPSVLRTARANFETPVDRYCRASSSKTICLVTRMSSYLRSSISFHIVPLSPPRNRVGDKEVRERIVAVAHEAGERAKQCLCQAAVYPLK